jgi:DNA mismatch endonuclease (patch repair protein)
MDVHDKETRSYNMSCIKGKGTKPEEIVRKYLFSHGFRYRKNDKRLPGTPDIVLPKYKTVIFVNGCFWHGHEGCKYFVWPKNNAEFWKAKILQNIERDKRDFERLENVGWKVIVVWECCLKRPVCTKTLEQLSINIKENHHATI